MHGRQPLRASRSLRHIPPLFRDGSTRWSKIRHDCASDKHGSFLIMQAKLHHTPGRSVCPPNRRGGGVSEDFHSRRRRKRDKDVTLDHSFKNIFMGFAFLVIAIALSRTIGAAWWFWMLLPAFSMMGTGIAQYIRVRERERRTSLAAPPPPPMGHAFPEQVRPPVASVTEGTTRHLGVEAPTRHLDHEPK